MASRRCQTRRSSTGPRAGRKQQGSQQQNAPATSGQSQQGAREPQQGQNQQQPQQGRNQQQPQQGQNQQQGAQGQNQQQGEQGQRQGGERQQGAKNEQPDKSGRIALDVREQTLVSDIIRQQRIQPVTNMITAMLLSVRTVIRFSRP